MRILVADDDRTVRFVIARTLQQLVTHAQVHEAASGRDALALLRMRRLDAILTDHWMAGASGLDVLEQARREQPFARRVLMSAKTRDAMGPLARHVGIDLFVEKPDRAEEWGPLLVSALGLDAPRAPTP